MSSLAEWLPGRARWLMLPSTLGNTLVALVAALYASSTLHFPPDTLDVFWTLVVTVASAGVAIAEVIAARRLRILRGLAVGRLPITPANRLRAIDEARHLPDLVARLGVACWVGAVSVVALLFGLLSTAPLALVGRIEAIGLLFGPMAAVVVGLLVGHRAQSAVEVLARGLSPEQIVSSLKAPSVSVSRRLIGFTVIMVALPSMVAMDVTRSLGVDVAELWFSQPPASRAQWLASAQSAMILKVVLLVGLTTLLAVLAAAVGATSIARPLQRVATDASALARGQLSDATLIAGDGEVWLISNVFSRLKERLVALVRQLSASNLRIASAAATLQVASQGSEGGAAEQAAALNQTSATTEELAQSARQIASSASAVQELARKTLEAAESGLGNAESFRAAIVRMHQDNRSVSAAVERLNGRVQQIGRIVEVINTVAERSDLLALSAELEGTRAGEVGRGFSLVAAEMRRLAENVLESTAEVEELIGEIRAATRQTADATERARALTEGSTALADEVAKSLTSVAHSARQTSDAVRTISLATQQQQTGTDQLAEAMADILGITQQSLATTRQLTAANERLQALSLVLAEVVNRFQRE
ncbi:MAG: methyl-accepting chemotaxis protein [Myxococcaceae bacterium]|nr:methyl-accepting chemotaxis protein [Myxococcaceae bacterium]